MEILVSYGEIFDKLVILDIKKDKIKDERLNNVMKEYDLLISKIEKYLIQCEYLYLLLKTINLKIWNKLEKFRSIQLSTQQEFTIFKKVTYWNDARFLIKKKINNFFSSDIKEEKGYTPRILQIRATKKYNKKFYDLIKHLSIFYEYIYIICNENFYNFDDINIIAYDEFKDIKSDKIDLKNKEIIITHPYFVNKSKKEYDINSYKFYKYFNISHLYNQTK